MTFSKPLTNAAYRMLPSPQAELGLRAFQGRGREVVAGVGLEPTCASCPGDAPSQLPDPTASTQFQGRHLAGVQDRGEGIQPPHEVLLL